ncbi:MAG TPA: GlxA family transcriptional regulator [Opitutaceae bacterium]|nr:GlxA family transcriptional regulator [Opitutaceae bacterium]
MGLVVYPGFQVLSLALATVFELANQTAGKAIYRLTLLSDSGGLVRSSLGFALQTARIDRRVFDTLIVAGNNEALPASPRLLRSLRQAIKSSRRVAATCTGAFILAQAGLLEGRRATTHWFFAHAFRRAYPKVTLDADRIFVVDGRVWTSAGMSAGIDLAIALVEKDLGPDIARTVAKKMVVYHRRAGGQSQHSMLLELDPKSDRIQTALAYAKENLPSVLSVEELAQAAHLSPRQFSRVFRAETGTSPAQAVERLRVEAARLMLESGRHSLDEISDETGFGDRERMRRAFLRAFGQSPQALRRVAQAQAVTTLD